MLGGHGQSDTGIIFEADRGHYIGVILDSDPKKGIRNYHPTWEIRVLLLHWRPAWRSHGPEVGGCRPGSEISNDSPDHRQPGA